MLEIQHLRLNRQDQHYDFDAKAPSASITLIRGASGIGKSTLLDCIAGFLSPTGKLCWNGTEFQQNLIHDRPLSLLQQGDNLFPHLNLLDNVCLGAEPSFRFSRDIKDRAFAILETVGLLDQAQQFPTEVSGGQSQRVGLARAILRHQFKHRPILLLDEPYSALDEDTANTMHDLVRTLCRSHGLCVLLVAHREVECDQVWDIKAKNNVVNIIDSYFAHLPVDG